MMNMLFGRGKSSKSLEEENGSANANRPPPYAPHVPPPLPARAGQPPQPPQQQQQQQQLPPPPPYSAPASAAVHAAARAPPPAFGPGPGDVFVPGAELKEARELSIHVVFSIDISGSMALQQDAFDRDAGRNAPKVKRFDAVKKDVLRYMQQLQSSDRVAACDVLLFGANLYEYRNVTTVAQLQKVLDSVTRFERSTRTDLALAKANEYFLEDCARAASAGWPSDRPSFFNIVLTDGTPNVPGLDVQDARRAVAQLIIEGTEAMRRDEDRTTLILQYGSNEYAPDSDTSQFLAFLDDSLQGLAVSYFRAKYPDAAGDDINYLYDACDTGRQCDTWAEKDPEGKMTGVRRDAYWDDNVERMFEIALCD